MPNIQNYPVWYLILVGNKSDLQVGWKRQYSSI